MIKRLFRDPFAPATDTGPQPSFEPELDPDLKAEHPVQKAAVDHYRALSAGREMPLWRDFSPKTAPPEILPHLLLLDVTPADPLQYRWRLMGTHVYETLKRDTTGKTFAELYEGQGLERMKVAPRWVLEHRRPLRTNSCGSFNRAGFIPSENLFLPFAGEDGSIIRILLVTVFQPPEEI